MDNIGDDIYFLDGAFAGTKVTITGYTNTTTVTVGTSNSGSGVAVMFMPFVAAARFWIAPLMVSLNAVTAATNGNLLYAEVAEVT